MYIHSSGVPSFLDCLGPGLGNLAWFVGPDLWFSASIDDRIVVSSKGVCMYRNHGNVFGHVVGPLLWGNSEKKIGLSKIEVGSQGHGRFGGGSHQSELSVLDQEP